MDESEVRRLSKVKAEIDGLRRSLERARKRVGVEPGELQQVVGIALRRAGLSLGRGAPRERVGKVDAFAIDPQHPAFARDPAWQDAFDDLRAPAARTARAAERVAPARAAARDRLRAAGASPTAAMPTTSSRSISSTGWCAACSAGS